MSNFSSQVQKIARRSDDYEVGSPYAVDQSIPIRHFLTWLRFGPTAPTWLRLLHRVMPAEQAVHNVRCRVCRRQPLSGLRYVIIRYILCMLLLGSMIHFLA
ncbi:hypothetical protein P879_12032 [Paragonimus westermani]|uniref:Uncharacterized protein n=1 Tax=Paragonimus westermani TaxID=34504 RepID=A0A8T0D648_9TREM|nr:hypothetical protein P879_12032 [Paragonimus westermani]